MNIVCNFKWLQYWKCWSFIADLQYETVILYLRPLNTRFKCTFVTVVKMYIIIYNKLICPPLLKK